MQVGDVRRSFSSGVLDPTLEAAGELELHRRGLIDGRNIIISPTGGFGDRGGFRHVAHVRNQLTPLSLDGAAVSAPSGGVIVTGFNPQTGEPIIEATNPVAPIGGGALVHVDFGAPVAVGCVDITDLSVDGDDALDSWRVEYSEDNVSWSTLGEAFDAYSDPTSRRAAAEPGDSVTARYWRVYSDASLGGRTVQVPALSFWREVALVSNVRAFSFSFDAGAQYMLVASDRTLEVYEHGARLVAIPSPFTHDQVPDISEAQSLDTLLLFHPDVQPWRVFRVRGDREWDARHQTFKEVPRVQFEGVTYTNGVNEKQALSLLTFNTNDEFTLAFKGERTAPIAWVGDNATTTANIASGLQALPTIGAGNVSVTREGQNYWVIEFTGTLAQEPQPTLSFSFIGPGDGNESISIDEVREGERGGEPLFGPLRGWPSCGRFYQQRLVLAGFKSRPASLAFSVLGDYYNFDVTIEEADAALVFGIDHDEMKRIRALFGADRLFLMTDDSEFFLANRAISAQEPPELIRTSGRGILAGSNVIEADDTVLFASASGDAIRAIVYDDGLQKFTAPPVSRLCPHLIKSPLGLASVRAGGPEGAELAVMANSDGSAAMCALLQAERFTPFVEWRTAEGDQFLGFAAEGRDTLYALTERGNRRRVEVYDPAFLYDGGAARSYPEPVLSVDGLQHLEGRRVELWLDGRPRGAVDVDEGRIDLPIAAREVQLGLYFEVKASLTPLSSGPGGLSLFDRYVRIEGVTVTVRNTGALSVQVGDTPARLVDLRAYGAAAFSPVDGALYTGDRRLKGLGRYEKRPSVSLAQPFRAPLRVLGISMEGRATR